MHDHLHMTKVYSTWVPHLLTPLQRHERVEACEELLAGYEEEGNVLLTLMTSHISITVNLNLNNGNELTLHYRRSLSKSSRNAKFFLALL